MKSFCVALIVVVAGALPAAAETKIVLESYTGGKTQATATLIEPLLVALARSGFQGGEPVGRSFESRVSRPAITAGLPADFAQKVDAAQQSFISGKFDEAVNTLAPLIDTARENTGAFASNRGALAAMEKALIVYALSQDRMGDGGAATATFGEFLRSFPDKTVPRATWGAQAATAFDNAKKALAPYGRGKLIVKSSVDTGVIFINEQIEQAGSVTKDDIPAGDYRVFVQLPGKQLSRQHRVTVRSKETTVLNIDAEFDVSVQTSKTWTGLSFSNPEEREKSELERAWQFASAIEADATVVVGVDQVRGKTSIVASLMNKTRSAELRRASVPLSPAPSAEQLEGLAQYVVGDLTSPPEGVFVNAAPPRVIGGGNAGPIDQPGTGGGAWGGWKWITGGFGIVALGIGGYLVATDGDCKTNPGPGVTCPDVYNNAVPGYLALGGGAVLTGLSVYLFVKSGGSSASTRSAYVLPTNGGAFAGYSARF